MPADDDERSESRLRQLAEIEFLKSAYTPDEACVISDANGCFVVRRALHLSLVKVELSIVMPTGYPVQEDAILIVEGWLTSSLPHIRKAALHAIPRLVDACQQSAVEAGGGEALWSVLCCADEWVQGSEWKNILDEHRCNSVHSARVLNKTESSDCKKNNSNVLLGRRIIYSHHIIANSKRRDLANLASQYKLGGYLKIGWPGMILIEGSESSCQSFVNEIKRWRWQQLQLRGEEQGSPLSHLLLKPTIPPNHCSHSMP